MKQSIAGRIEMVLEMLETEQVIFDKYGEEIGRISREPMITKETAMELLGASNVSRPNPADESAELHRLNWLNHYIEQEKSMSLRALELRAGAKPSYSVELSYLEKMLNFTRKQIILYKRAAR